MTLLIPLGGKARGRNALIDHEDDWVLKHRWSLDGHGYVQARIEGKTVTLHRLLFDFPAGILDHVNRNKLDNRRVNLRVTDARGNARNQSKREGTTSRHMNVYRHTQTGRWAATGSLNKRSVYLGCYGTEEEAAEAARHWRIRTLGFDRVAGDTSTGEI